jgi:hypothetical protein
MRVHKCHLLLSTPGDQLCGFLLEEHMECYSPSRVYYAWHQTKYLRFGYSLFILSHIRILFILSHIRILFILSHIRIFCPGTSYSISSPPIVRSKLNYGRKFFSTRTARLYPISSVQQLKVLV